MRKEGSDSIFDKNFIAVVQKRRDSLAKLSLQLVTFQIPIFAFLIFALIPLETHISFLGISPTTNRNLREILIIASACLGVVAAFINLNQAVLSDMIASYARQRSKGDKDVNEFLNLGYGITYFALPNITHGKFAFGWGYLAFLTLLGAIIIALLLLLVAAAIYIHFLILRDIFYHPSYSQTVSLCTIIIVSGCDFISLSVFLLQAGYLPMQNFESLYTLTRLQDVAPKKANEIYKQIAIRHARKPWLLQLITRPKMPNKLPAD